MKGLLVMAVLALAAVPAEARDWTLSGARGGTVTGSGSCARGDARLTCNRSGVYEGPGGLVLNHETARVTTPAGTTKTLTTSGPRGGSVTTVRSRTHGRGARG